MSDLNDLKVLVESNTPIIVIEPWEEKALDASIFLEEIKNTYPL